ncbi:ArnT family glycosyltransferase [Bacterioplanes sanyensis]|nr:glycosyltransferase family 39 protein [Bacterioplanes sanyensis]
MRKLNFPWWLLPALAGLFFLNLNGFLLFDHDEGAFSEATRGMFERGDFITTYLNDRLRFDKPILIYWLQAASIYVFDIEVWAFRLPSALAGILWSLAIFFFARRYLNEATATAAALMAASALGINAIAHVATADAVLNMFLATTLLCIYHYSQSPSNRLLLAIYALMALGTLTKGPVAVAIPLLVACLYYLSSGLKPQLLKALFYFPGWALYLAIAAPWYVLIYLDQGQAFIDGFFLKHNVNRFKNAMEGHDGGLLFYPLVLPFVLAPFGGLLIRILPSIKHIRHGDGGDSDNNGQTLDRFLWIWFLVVLVLFSVASTKLPHYILYGCTPLVILMARYRHWLSSRWLAAVFPTLFFALLAALPSLVPSIEASLTNPIEVAVAQRAAEYINQEFAMLAAGAGVLSLLLIFALRRLAPWLTLVLVGGVQALFVWLVLAPAASEAQQRPVWEAAQFARLLNEPIVTQSIDMPSFNVYLNRVTERRGLEVGEVGYGREDRIDIDHFETLFQSGPIMLVRRLPPPTPTLEAPAQSEVTDE